MSQRKKKSVTLLELIIAIVIVGILVAMAIPLFPRAMEFTRSKQAVAALRQIHTAQRIYKLKEGFYYPHYLEGGDPPTVADMESIFKVSLDTQDWDYSLSTTAEDEFTATATRAGGSESYDEKTIEIDTSGDTHPGGVHPWPLPLPQQ
jgi:type II secretory pathway pseudopilin PulG